MADNKQNTNPNVPNLRFPEFKGVWKDSNIGRCFDLYSGNTPSRMEKEHFIGDVNWITSGELKEHYIGDTKERISEKAAADNNLRILPIGTFVMAIYGLEAEGVRGTCSITVKTSTISQACMAFTPKSNVSNEFLYSWYKKHGNKIGIRYAQGTKQQNLSYDIIEKFPIIYPSIEEQEKLNTFISLLDERIATQNKIIQQLQSLIKGIRYIIYTQLDCEWIQLSNLVVKGLITLKRGNVIPKYEYSDEYCYPVYSSSTQNGGLMGYFNTYMFDKSLISWSIDGGGNFFYRDKHKFNVTNVCGYLEADESKFDYRFISELLIYQHSRMVFDYQTKAHPSVIEAMYYLPILDLEKQQCYSKLFEHIYDKLDRETSLLNKYEEQKKFLLSNMFI